MPRRWTPSPWRKRPPACRWDSTAPSSGIDGSCLRSTAPRGLERSVARDLGGGEPMALLRPRAALALRPPAAADPADLHGRGRALPLRGCRLAAGEAQDD